MTAGPVVYTCDDHSSVYYHLIGAGARGLSVTHLDAHCDLKGTLIDIDAKRAWLRRPELEVSASTYLSHLVAEGIVGDVEWVHDEIGGRENDLGTVLYTSDLRRLAYRAVRRPEGAGVPLRYRESQYAAWQQRESDRVLDIDWDFFADWRKDASRIEREIEQLLSGKIVIPPRLTYVAYSAHYSRPGIDEYRRFVDRLAAHLSARVEAIPEAPLPRAGAVARGLPPGLRRLLRAQVLKLKRVWMR